MSKETTKSWYLGHSYLSSSEYYLFQADSLFAAEDRMDDLNEAYNLFPATWADLKKLIGCSIPEGVKGYNIATGLLTWDSERANTQLLM